MFAGEEAVLRRWLRPPYRFDGWRLDVSNMMARQGEAQLAHKIGRGIRRAIKQENPDAYILGENFFDGSPHLQGEELDATMNYQGFMFPILRWLAGADLMHYGERVAFIKPHPMPTEAMEAQLRAFMAAIPWQIAVQQFNLLSSHDTPRVMTVTGEDEHRVKVAATLLFAYPGTPCVYYGDEIGLPGGRDPDNRRCMPWDPADWNSSLRDHHRALIRLRRASAALRSGGYQVLLAEGDTFAFLREGQEEQAIAVARRGADGLTTLPVRHGGIPDGAHFREALTGATATVQGGMLPLEGLGAVDAQIWQRSR
jgi:alpha-glucosidase